MVTIDPFIRYSIEKMKKREKFIGIILASVLFLSCEEQKEEYASTEERDLKEET